MSDLISRQAALTKRTVHERLIIAKTLVESVLDDLPSAQPERKTGRWEIKADPYEFFDEGIPVCSCCGCTNTMRLKYNYCPRCGAKMETEVKE